MDLFVLNMFLLNHIYAKYKSTRLLPFARFNKVHHARFSCGVSTSVCLQPGYMHKEIASSAYIVRAPVPVLGLTQSFQAKVLLGLAGVRHLRPQTPLGTWDWHDSFLSGPQVTYRLAGLGAYLSLFSPPSTCLLYTSPSPRD